MKVRLFQILCSLVAGVLGWHWIDRDHALPTPKTPVADGRGSLLVPRKMSSNNLSIAWLLRFDQKLVNANEARLKKWLETTLEWPRVKGALGRGLVQARLQVITPVELRKTEFNNTMEDQFVSYFLAVLTGDPAASLPQLTGKDAAATLQILSSETPWRIFQESNLLDHRFVESVIKRLGEEDPENALGMVRKFKDWHSVRRSSLTAVMSVWIEKDPEALGTYLDTIDPGRERKELGQMMLMLAAKASPRETLENLDWYTAIGFEDPASRHHIVHQWANDDPEAALAWIEEQADAEHFAHLKLDTVARQDVHAAMALYDEMSEKEQIKAAPGLAREWQKQDSDANELLEWVREFGDVKLKDATLTDIATSMTKSEPDKAWNLLQEVLASEDDSISVYSLAEIAKALESGNPGFSQREGVLDALLARAPKVMRSDWMEDLARANPDWVAERFEQHADTEDAPRGVFHLVTNWLSSDPSGAAAWVANLEAGSLRDSAQIHLMNEWTSAYPDEATNWIQDHLTSGDPGWDEAHRSLAGTAADRLEFDSALRLAESLVEEAGRAQALEGVFREWSARNPAQAIAAFEDFDASPDLREQIEKKVFHALPPEVTGQ